MTASEKVDAHSHSVHDKPEPATLLRSQRDLDTWLKRHDKGNTPFDRMPPGTRLRFMASLQFSDRGLAGFDPVDLGATLSPADIRTVLALFLSGTELEHWSKRIQSRRPDNIQTLIDAPIGAIEARFNQLYLLDLQVGPRPDNERGRILAARYAELFPHATQTAWLRAVSDSDLKLLYRAADLANYYTPSAYPADAMAQALDSMATRGLATSEDFRAGQRALLSARRFDAAARFTRAHPNLPALPVIETSAPGQDTRPTLWHLDANGTRLTRVPVDLRPLQILVISGCHFSEDAALGISQDPVLGPIFRDHARWLMQPPGQESIEDVREWNRKYPDAQAEMIYDRSQWDMLGRWVMPTYVIVKDGKMLDSAKGWPPNPDRQHLIDILNRAGFKLGDAASDRNHKTMPEDSSTAHQ